MVALRLGGVTAQKHAMALLKTSLLPPYPRPSRDLSRARVFQPQRGLIHDRGRIEAQQRLYLILRGWRR